jgi:hypothetical protein
VIRPHQAPEQPAGYAQIVIRIKRFINRYRFHRLDVRYGNPTTPEKVAQLGFALIEDETEGQQAPENKDNERGRQEQIRWRKPWGIASPEQEGQASPDYHDQE